MLHFADTVILLNDRLAPEAVARREDVMELVCKLTDKVSTLSYSVWERSRFRLEPHGLDDAVPDGAGEIDLDGPVAVHLQLDLGVVGPRLAAVGGLNRSHEKNFPGKKRERIVRKSFLSPFWYPLGSNEAWERTINT